MSPIVTSHVYPPIPDRRFDWCAYRDPEGTIYGEGPTEAAAIADFIEQEQGACGDPLDAFFEALTKTPRGWRLNSVGALRCDGHCPISAVTGDRGDFDWPCTAARRKLGLPDAVASHIPLAADNDDRSPGFDPALRQRLLVACGLA